MSLDGILQARPVRCAAVDHEYIHLATVGDDKQLRVWAVDSLDLLSERCATSSFPTPFTSDFKRQRAPEKADSDFIYALWRDDCRRGQIW